MYFAMFHIHLKTTFVVPIQQINKIKWRAYFYVRTTPWLSRQ